MKSPFPGMDPFLETRWRDVHTRIMTLICDQIQDQLPADLVARVEESILVDDGENDSLRTASPDVAVIENFESEVGVATLSTVAIAKPLWVVEDPRQISRHVQILDSRSGDRVVTAIEVLSPTNKTTKKGRQEYEDKQWDYLHAGINLVEIDLLRCGQQVINIEAESFPFEKHRTYMMAVSRPARVEIYGASLREPLPVLPIPLRWSDRDVVLPLQTVIDEVYERGRYWKLNYRAPLNPPLSAEDAAWANELLTKAGKLQPVQ